MNFHTIFEELDRLYESEAKKANSLKETAEDEEQEAAIEEIEAEEADKVEDEVEIVDDEVAEEPAEAGEEKPEQVVLECANCGGIIVKAIVDVKADEESELVNIEEKCKYCDEADGFKILGAMVAYEEAEEVEDDGDEDIEVVDDEEQLGEFLDIKLDARGFGGSGNDVSILGEAATPNSWADHVERFKEEGYDVNLVDNYNNTVLLEKNKVLYVLDMKKHGTDDYSFDTVCKVKDRDEFVQKSEEIGGVPVVFDGTRIVKA